MFLEKFYWIHLDSTLIPAYENVAVKRCWLDFILQSLPDIYVSFRFRFSSPLPRWIKYDSLVSTCYCYSSLSAAVLFSETFLHRFSFFFFFPWEAKHIRALWLRIDKGRQPNSEVGRICLSMCSMWTGAGVRLSLLNKVLLKFFGFFCWFFFFLLRACWCVCLPQFCKLPVSNLTVNKPRQTPLHKHCCFSFFFSIR